MLRQSASPFRRDQEGSCFFKINFAGELSCFVSQPLLKGNSPVRGDVCEADKGVPVFGEKGGEIACDFDGEVCLPCVKGGGCDLREQTEGLPSTASQPLEQTCGKRQSASPERRGGFAKRRRRGQIPVE